MKKVVYFLWVLCYNNHVSTTNHNMQTTIKFPSHEEIYKQMLELFNASANWRGMHNRESLDDLISDLEQYRRTLPTVEEYIVHDLL
jgi:hypothetical protein